MRTKRGGFKASKPKQGKPRVRIRATGAANPPKVPDKVRLDLSGFRIVSIGGREIAIEPPDAGLKRYLRFRAPRHLWV